jgi:nitroimidazol reductase NimA-like FMN-containing flavoprotein (pyridoxamine 5'-phosphate oxidase superfamily)
MLHTQPKRSRLQTQKAYGIPTDEAGMLSWHGVSEQLLKARNYWLVTVRPDGRPHTVPVWGVWVDGTFFGMRRHTRKARNIAENPQVVVHLDSSEEVVMGLSQNRSRRLFVS